MKSSLLITLFCLSFNVAFGQKEWYNWYFGDHAGITFKSGKPVAVSNGQVNVIEGCSSISDKVTGDLLFYTDGVTVWDKNHNIMKNGKGLKSGTSCTQSALIVSNPSNSLQYYIFTSPDQTPGTGETRTYYSIVSLEKPIPEVISKNIILMDGITEKLTGTADSSGAGYWILTHDKLLNIFYSFHVTTRGVEPTPISSSYEDYNLNEPMTSGYLRISPDGKKIAIANADRYSSSFTNYHILTLFDFNNATGKVLNPLVLEKGTCPFYGLAFSPDNSKLYASTSLQVIDTLFQYDISLKDSIAIKNSRTIVNTSNDGGAIALAPDGKIYVASVFNNFLSVIDKPNEKAPDCNFKSAAVPLTSQCIFGLPNFMDYNIGLRPKNYVICLGSNVIIGPSPLKGYSYSWTPATGLNNPKIANPIASPTKTTEYLLSIVNDVGIESSQIYKVSIDTVKATISTVPPICVGASAQLFASGGNSFLWSPTTGLDNPTKPNPIATPKISTRYKVEVTQGSCTDSAFVDVELIKSGANAGTDKTVCPGANTQLGVAPAPNNTYSWQPVTDLDNPNIANPIVSPGSSRQYILTVTNELGCKGQDTVWVTVGNIKAIVSKDTAICPGSSIQLSASGGSEYLWSPATGLDNPNLQNPIASPTSTTTYTVLVSSGNCRDSASVNITVNPLPITYAGEDKSICQNDPVVIGSDPISGYSYSWNPSTGLDNPSSSKPIASPTTTTKYILTATNMTNCIAMDTVLVSVGPLPISITKDTTLCTGSTVQLQASGGINYSWSPIAGLNNPNISNPIASPDVTTTYKVTVSQGNCIDSAFVKVTLLSSLPTDAGEDKSICLGESVQIGSKQEAGNTYSWTPTIGLLNPDLSQTIASPMTTTTYTLKMISGSCISYDSVLVTVNPLIERSFTFNPSIITIIPGKAFDASLKIASDINDWNISVNYDPQIVAFSSILQSNGINLSSSLEKNGRLFLTGSGKTGDIDMRFNAFLPYNSDTTFSMKIVADTSKMQQCESIVAPDAMLVLGEYCGRRIRSVNSTGKNYFLSSKENKINFGVALSGNVRLELYNYTGKMEEVLMNGFLEAGEYSVDIDMPYGLYFVRINAGMYDEMVKVVLQGS